MSLVRGRAWKREDFGGLERITARDKEVVQLLMAGASNDDIGKTLGVSPRTIKQHIGRMMLLNDVKNRSELALKALNAGIPEAVSHPKLSSRVALVAKYAAIGYTNPEIASMAGTSPQVIKNYLRQAYNAFGVWTRLELTVMLAVPKETSNVRLHEQRLAVSTEEKVG